MPGIQNLGRVTDRLGRTGWAFGLTQSGLREEIIYDPATSAVLEEETVGNPRDTGSAFSQGSATFSGPAGHYFAIADFVDTSSDGTVTGERVVTVPQFTADLARIRQHAVKPATRYCADGMADCDAEPMMTLEYDIAGLALDGTAAGGQISETITSAYRTGTATD